MDKCEQDTRLTLSDLVRYCTDLEGRIRLDMATAMFEAADDLLPRGREYRGHLSWAAVELILGAAGIDESWILPTP